MLRIALCDDSLQEPSVLFSMLRQYQADRPTLDVQVSSFRSGGALLENLQNGGYYHLYLLDIAAPEQDSLILAREIRIRQANVPVVYFTFSADFALKIFEIYAFSYLRKPTEPDKLFPILDRLAWAQKNGEERSFVLSAPSRTIKMPFASIVCVELFGRCLRLYCENGDVVLSKTIRNPFAASVAPLLEDSRYLCAHKSYVVNMTHIESLTATSFVMKHGLEVPIPRYKYAETRAKYFAWLSQCGVTVAGGVR